MEPLRFVVALDAEARPLVERYGLTRDPARRSFRLYRQRDGGDGVALVVTGPGKVAAAAGAAYLHLAASGGRDGVWLNVGTAGHGERPVGEVVLAHKVRERGTGRSWYPPQLFDPPCATDEVVTVERPETAFSEPGAYEMEAAGFYPTACRFATAELVHCLKVISDGPEAPGERLDAAAVTELVASATSAVEVLAAACSELAAELRGAGADPPELEACLARWRFTASDRRELHRLLRRRRLLAPEAPLPTGELPGHLRGREVNRRLRRWLDSLPVPL